MDAVRLVRCLASTKKRKASGRARLAIECFGEVHRSLVASWLGSGRRMPIDMKCAHFRVGTQVLNERAVRKCRLTRNRTPAKNSQVRIAAVCRLMRPPRRGTPVCEQCIADELKGATQRVN